MKDPQASPDPATSPDPAALPDPATAPDPATSSNSDALAAHSHGPLELPKSQRRRVRAILAAIVIPLLLATAAGMFFLWPSDVAAIGSLDPMDSPEDYATGTVTEIVDHHEYQAFIAVDGEETEVPVQIPPEVLAGGLAVGDHIKVYVTMDALGTGSPYVYVDGVRDTPLLILLGLYVLVVLLVARWKGIAALAGLGASLAVVLLFLIPALFAGENALAVTLIGASAVMFLAVYLAHGISIRTTTALLGTFVGLSVTTGLALWGTRAAGIVGYGNDTSSMFSAMIPDVSLRDVILAGMVIAGLGALNDVTITQASSVWEIHRADPSATTGKLFTSAMRIGRDHIASTVYTLAFAYVGTALALLMVVMLIDRSAIDILTSGEIAEEIVRTLVASIGLVVAIPATTGLAALLVHASAAPTEIPPREPAPKDPPSKDSLPKDSAPQQ